jgi:hypothetical protein
MIKSELVICIHNYANNELEVGGIYNCTFHISEVPFW